MPGMSSGLNANNSTIIAAFKAALVHQFLIALLIVAVAALAWQLLRISELRRAGDGESNVRFSMPSVGPYVEAPARRLARVAFGGLWILDGLLQAQPHMPLGMTTSVIEPAAASSPVWVQHAANAGATIWSYHPIQAPASAVWIQIGIGLWLLVSPRGMSSRLAGVVAAAWGLVVWVFGEAFGGIFAPGLTWLFGAPGAVLIYAVAGSLVAMPEHWWLSARAGRVLLRGIGLFFIGMAVLQAWPGRGVWQGYVTHSHQPGTLAGMVQAMAQTSQPHFLSSWLAAFGSFDMANGFAVNLVVVIALAAFGVSFLVPHLRVLRYSVIACCVLCLADWILIEDLGFLGGVGTDPNSMIPMALLVVTGYLAVAKVPAREEALAPISMLASVQPVRERVAAWCEAVIAHPARLLRPTVAFGALGIVLLGAAPMAVASMNPNADPIIAQATNGTPNVTNVPARNFHLIDQFGRSVSLATFRGKTVALTFLDPVCTSSCPLTAQAFRIASNELGQLSRKVELVAIVANPLYRNRSYIAAFDQQEGLQHLPNWLFLSGSTPSLASAWSSYGIQVQYETGGAMIGHSEIAYVIDSRGHIRSILQADPGPGTAAALSSFEVTLANSIRSVMQSS